MFEAALGLTAREELQVEIGSERRNKSFQPHSAALLVNGAVAGNNRASNGRVFLRNTQNNEAPMGTFAKHLGQLATKIIRSRIAVLDLVPISDISINADTITSQLAYCRGRRLQIAHHFAVYVVQRVVIELLIFLVIFLTVTINYLRG